MKDNLQPMLTYEVLNIRLSASGRKEKFKTGRNGNKNGQN